MTKWVNILAAIYISLPIIVALCILTFYIIGKTIPKETLEKLLDYSKWYMVAVAIVFAIMGLITGVLSGNYTQFISNFVSYFVETALIAILYNYLAPKIGSIKLNLE